MNDNFTRRDAIKAAAALSAGLLWNGLSKNLLADDKKPLFEISLAEWSFHRTIGAGGMDNLDFARVAKHFCGISAIEFVNQFFKDKARDEKYLTELKKRSDDHGVKNLLIMIDGEGQLGDPDKEARKKAVENHHRWVDAAKHLGCHSIRVNAASSGSYDEQRKLAADGLRQLSEYGAKHHINVIVENHGGLSSNGAWLAAVLKDVGMDNCGSLPDFGNFYDYDRYQGVKDLMPFAKGVSAKSHDFNKQGEETKTDYYKMMKIVLDAGYNGYVGIEYEGGNLSEMEGVLATRKLLERVREKMSS